MKIESIGVSNFQMLTDININLAGTPICLIAGANEQGKSSLHEAIRFALTGESTRVKLKKDMDALVRDGTKTGGVIVRLENGNSAELELPAGKVTTVGALVNDLQLKALPLVMDAGRFAAMTENDRRAFLFDLSGLQCDSKNVGDRLVARGCDAKKVEAIAPLLRNGFPAAETEARTKVREKKAIWKTVTGGETWGKDKAAKWQPAALPPESDKAAGRAENARQKAIEVERELSAAQQELGAARAELQRRQQAETEREHLAEKAGTVGRFKSKLAHDEAELKQWEAKVEETRAKAGAASVNPKAPGEYLLRGLAAVADEFLVVAGNHHDIDWPEELINRASAHLAEYKKLHGWPFKSGDQADPEAVARLPEHERALTLLQSAVANSKRDLAAAESAAAKLAELDGEKVEAIDLEAIQAKVSELGEKRSGWRADADKYQAIAEQAKRHQEVIDQAAALHGDILAWSDIADALAPDGIPGEMLADAIKPLNDRLRSTSMATGWDQVSIDAEMQIRVDGRLYSLKSESAKWRADAAIAEAISNLSDLRFIAIDRCDVMDTGNRLAFLKWLHGLAASGEIDTALVFGTFKSLPTVPATFLPVWIERGAIVQHKEAA